MAGGSSQIMSFKLPVHALLAQVRSQRDKVNANKGDVGVSTTGKVLVTQAGPQTRSAGDLQDAFRWAIGQVRVAKRAAKDAQQHRRAQALTVDLGQVAWQWIEVFGVAEVSTLAISREGVVVVVREGSQGRGGGCGKGRA